MKTKLIILFILIASLCGAQSPKWFTLNINYFPKDVFETNNFQAEAAFHVGLAEDFIRIGALVRSDNQFEHMSIGIENQLAVITGMIDVNILAGIGSNTNRTNLDERGEPNRQHYLEYGLLTRYASTETISIHQFFKRQFYNGRGVFYAGIGASYAF